MTISNRREGAAGGSISLMDSDGNVYGPWDVTTEPGQGGVPDAYWIAYPDEFILAGEYAVEDF